MLQFRILNTLVQPKITKGLRDREALAPIFRNFALNAASSMIVRMRTKQMTLKMPNAPIIEGGDGDGGCGTSHMKRTHTIPYHNHVTTCLAVKKERPLMAANN